MRLLVETVICAAFLLAATSACAHAGDRVLPPEKYDHPYHGSLIVKRGLDERDMLVNCPNTPAFGYPRLGCNYRFPSQCVIFLADDKVIRDAGHKPDIVLRHEIGHCNGWPANHEGGRSEEEANSRSGVFYPLLPAQ